jgi:fructoselysine-6-P-deglycase FrlB-like protein
VSHVEDEIASQPECWARAADLVADLTATAAGLPAPGERIAVVGCGTSYYMAQAYARLREAAGQGESDAWPASELPARSYDRVLAITRSGTTTEVLAVLAATTVPTTVLTTARDLPAARAASAVVVLDFADERSVVQTRFATTVLALLRASVGADLGPVVAQARTALTAEVPDGGHVVFLGTGWTAGLAGEAALKLTEAARHRASAYVAMEYRHGPLALADEDSLVWFLGPPPAGLVEEIVATGARVRVSTVDPMAELVLAQRFAVTRALAGGLDPDRPRNLSRSVVLGPQRAARRPGGE